jgi:hypothetical protein
LLRPSLFKRLLGVQLLVFGALLAVLLSLTLMLLLARGNGGWTPTSSCWPRPWRAPAA